MPNTMSKKELEDLHFVHAGEIRQAGRGCDVQVQDLKGCVLYVWRVDGRVQKFGSTYSLKVRMTDNKRTINDLLDFQDGRPPRTSAPTHVRWLERFARGATDKFQQQAPGLIRAGKVIEVWATSRFSPTCPDPGRKGQCPTCVDLESLLNRRYQTIQYGWASREH
jgi:hypothetical protein